jgi:hypothetical protein
MGPKQLAEVIWALAQVRFTIGGQKQNSGFPLLLLLLLLLCGCICDSRCMKLRKRQQLTKMLNYGTDTLHGRLRFLATAAAGGA